MSKKSLILFLVITAAIFTNADQQNNFQDENLSFNHNWLKLRKVETANYTVDMDRNTGGIIVKRDGIPILDFTTVLRRDGASHFPKLLNEKFVTDVKKDQQGNTVFMIERYLRQSIPEGGNKVNAYYLKSICYYTFMPDKVKIKLDIEMLEPFMVYHNTLISHGDVRTGIFDQNAMLCYKQEKTGGDQPVEIPFKDFIKMGKLEGVTFFKAKLKDGKPITYALSPGVSVYFLNSVKTDMWFKRYLFERTQRVKELPTGIKSCFQLTVSVGD